MIHFDYVDDDDLEFSVYGEYWYNAKPFYLIKYTNTFDVEITTSTIKVELNKEVSREQFEKETDILIDQEKFEKEIDRISSQENQMSRSLY